jgi:hypothetical protein
MAAELTTNESLNHRANQVHTGTSSSSIDLDPGSHADICHSTPVQEPEDKQEQAKSEKEGLSVEISSEPTISTSDISNGSGGKNSPFAKVRKVAHRLKKGLFQYAKFIGPGFMVSVAYIDPGIITASLWSPGAFD